jgi:hypothetical protein
MKADCGELRLKRSYLSLVGDSWASAHDWRRIFPDQPFLGVRHEGRTAWVIFEPHTARGPLQATLVRAIQEVFEEAGSDWVDEKVFIHEAPSLGAGHRFARRVARILRSDASSAATGCS